MRTRRSSTLVLVALGVLVHVALPPLRSAAQMHPVEAELRRSFPAVSLDSRATFHREDVFVGPRAATGLRARIAGDRAPVSVSVPDAVTKLGILFPESYDGSFVAELGAQRVVLRATGAIAAPAVVSNGTLVYTRPYRNVDVVQVPHEGRSEELLFLQDQSAPRVFEYQFVALDGVAGVTIEGGAVRFLPQPQQVEAGASTGRFSQPLASLQIDAPWIIDANGLRSDRHAQWTLVGKGAMPTGIRLTIDAQGLTFPLVVDPSFSSTGNLGTTRFQHTSTLLLNGKVLVAGGGSSGLSTAELYDPATGAFTATGSMTTARTNHTATLLPNGKVLIAGGFDGSGRVTSAELYDPASGQFTATGNMSTGRESHTATLMQNGKVLVAGGYNNLYVSSAEIYDPAAGTFTPTGGLATERRAHTATLLASGKVLIAGGNNTVYLNSVELYDPTTGNFTATGPMSFARRQHSSTLLPNGKVLVAGGHNSTNGFLTSSELYDPATGSFTATGSLAAARYWHSATLLPDGNVLVAGGATASIVGTAEIYQPSTGTFVPAGNLVLARAFHTATLLPNAKVLLSGGSGNSGLLTSAELYDPASGAFSTTGSLNAGRETHTSTMLPDGTVLIAGGEGQPAATTSVRYDPATGVFNPSGTLASRWWHKATLLQNGKVLITGGQNSSVVLSSNELYDPDTGTFTPTGLLQQGRFAGLSATLLPSGKVLIAGGQTSSPAAGELYEPSTGLFTQTGNMITPRRLHSATLLPNGKVLLAGGLSLLTQLQSAELYDPATGAFTATGSLFAPRVEHTATLLPNGQVLIAGGYLDGGSTMVTTGELYDPATGSFTPTGALGTGRSNHTATLLADGKVLIAGGQGGGSYLSSAELYEPVKGTFSPAGSLATTRRGHTATLLTTGKVLIAGGFNGSGPQSSAELYDPGTGFSDAQRPVISGASTTLMVPASMSITGTGFRGTSEAAGGETNSSATNYPLLRLQRVDNDQVVFVPATAGWSDVSWGGDISGVATGPWRLTIVSNAIPSAQRILRVVNVAPGNVVAEAASATSVNVSWSSVAGATQYQLMRSSNGVNYTPLGLTAGTSLGDGTAAAYTAYLYGVRVTAPYVSEVSTPDLATTVMFSDDPLVAGGTIIKAAHLTELRRAVTAVRTLAGLGAPTVTDPTISAGVTAVKSAHVTELRTALSDARAALALPSISYGNATTLIYATNFTELRAGTR